MELDGFREAWNGLDGPQEVGNRRAAPGAGFQEQHGRGGTSFPPALRQGQTDELAEDLADLGCGDEVARRTERVARGIIAAPNGAQRRSP